VAAAGNCRVSAAVGIATAFGIGPSNASAIISSIATAATISQSQYDERIAQANELGRCCVPQIIGWLKWTERASGLSLLRNRHVVLL
jgi:hypothetical protein